MFQNPYFFKSEVVFAAILVFGIVLTLVLWWYVSRKKNALSEKAILTLKKCPVCGGALEQGQIWAYGLGFKAGRRAYQIGAARCKACGYIALFS